MSVLKQMRPLLSIQSQEEWSIGVHILTYDEIVGFKISEVPGVRYPGTYLQTYIR